MRPKYKLKMVEKAVIEGHPVVDEMAKRTIGDETSPSESM